MNEKAAREAIRDLATSVVEVEGVKTAWNEHIAALQKAVHTGSALPPTGELIEMLLRRVANKITRVVTVAGAAETPPPPQTELPNGSANVAKEIWGATPTASGNGSYTGYSLGGPLDGSANTGWFDPTPATVGSPDIYTVQLPGGVSQSFGRIVIQFAGAPYGVQDFTVQYSSNGTSWTTFSGGTFTGNAASTITLNPAGAVSGSWVRLHATRGDQVDSTTRIFNFEVWTYGTPNPMPPGVSITSPTSSTAVAVGGDIQITAEVNDFEGNLATTRFYDNGVEISGSAISSSANGTKSYLYQNMASAGNRSITVRGTDAGGLYTEKSVTVTVSSGTTITPPVFSDSGGDNFAERTAPSTIWCAHRLADAGAADANMAGRQQYTHATNSVHALRGTDAGPDGSSRSVIDQGSLFFDWPANVGTGWGGDYFYRCHNRNTNEPIWFNENSEHWFQVELMINDVFAQENWRKPDGTPITFKLFDLNDNSKDGYFGITSSDVGKLVIVADPTKHFPRMYDYGDGGEKFFEVGLATNYGNDTDRQPRFDSSGTGHDRVLAYRDEYGNPPFGLTPAPLWQKPRGARGCVWPNEWMHYQVQVILGNALPGQPAYPNPRKVFSTIRLYGGRQNQPSELIIEWSSWHWVTWGMGMAFLFTSFTGMGPAGVNGNFPRQSGSWIRYKNPVFSQVRVADPKYTDAPAWMSSATVNVPMDIPNSGMTPSVIADNKPAFDDTGLYTFHPSQSNGCSGGSAWDLSTNERFLVGDGGHSFGNHTGGWKQNLLTGVWSIVQQSSEFPIPPSAPPAADDGYTNGRTWDPAGRRLAAHNGYAPLLVKTRKGTRVVVLPLSFGINHNSSGSYEVTTGFWPDRVGEKWDLYGGGWQQNPGVLAQSQYPGMCVDERTGLVWVWGRDGRVWHIDPSTSTGTIPWTLFADLGGNYNGHDRGICADIKRYRLVSIGQNPALVVPPGPYVQLMDTRTGATGFRRITGSGAGLFAQTAAHTHLIYDWLNDQIIAVGFAAAPGPYWSSWATISGAQMEGQTSWEAITATHQTLYSGGNAGVGFNQGDGHAAHRSAFMPRMKGIVVSHRHDLNVQYIKLI